MGRVAHESFEAAGQFQGPGSVMTRNRRCTYRREELTSRGK